MAAGVSYADIVGWIGIGITIVVTLVASNTYLIRELERRIPFSEYDKRHRELEERLRKIEMWAAKKSYSESH